jgi:hypothetical protein
MADENLIDGHDVAWWKAQWDAMKKENDKLNPLAESLRAELQAVGEARGQEVRDLHTAHATDKAAALDAQKQQLQAQYKGVLSDLAKQHWLPAMNDLHARQRTDFLAKQQADLDELNKLIQ